MTKRTLDTARQEAFAARMMEVLNAGATCMLVSIGHRTGLFDTMAPLPPSTSEQIAAAAGLQERYVREWLAGMVVSRVVEYDPESRTYDLPPEHAAFLTRAATPNNLAVYGQYVGVLGGIEDRIIECFRNGGGVPYEAYTRFHEVMAEDSGQTVLPVLLDQILPLAPGLVERLQGGIEVLDIGCGAGRAVNLMARTFPRSRFLGVDLSEEGIGLARAEAARLKLSNAVFEVKDLTDFDLQGRFDLVTAFDAVHDQARPDQVLAGVARVLAPGGVFIMQDIAGSSHLPDNVEHPLAPFLYTASCLHCMPVSLAQGGMGLGTMWGEDTARRMLADAGFAHVRVEHLPHDLQNVYFVAQTEASSRADSRREAASARRT